MTLAASNWQKALTFVGRNFAFRPYFIEAMRGGAGRYYALGTTSGAARFYFPTRRCRKSPLAWSS